MLKQHGCELSTCFLYATVTITTTSTSPAGKTSTHDSSLSSSVSIMKEELPPAVFYMTTMKDAAVGTTINPTSYQLINAQRLSSHEIQFILIASVTSPFLFIELLQDKDLLLSSTTTSSSSSSSSSNTNSGTGTSSSRDDGIYHNNAGWFSDNNFLAIAHVRYSIIYTAHKEIKDDVQSFMKRLQVRSLLDVKSRC